MDAALAFIEKCKYYYEFPIVNCRKKVAMVLSMKYRYVLEEKLKRANTLNFYEIIRLQNALNELPMYLTLESTLYLYQCMDFVKKADASTLVVS